VEAADGWQHRGEEWRWAGAVTACSPSEAREGEREEERLEAEAGVEGVKGGVAGRSRRGSR